MPADQNPSDAIEALLFECLEHDDPTAALDRACAEQPDMADALRRRFATLEGAGMLEPPTTPPGAGDRFGSFTLLEELGRGGMGIVYLAEQPSMNRHVALKVIREDYLRNPRAQQRFRREIEAVSRLDHPAICTVYEAGEVSGTPFIAMRYVQGQPLARLLTERREETGPESETRSSRAATNSVLNLIEKVARGLHAAHEAGLVHRDVKPGNIMVTTENEPVLLDFGLAREVESTQASLTVTGDVVGTPAYMSPEQISGHGTAIDRRSDVYSLGVTLFECLTLHLPFSAPTREGLYRQILEGRMPDLRGRSTSGGAMSKDLQVVLATAMARDPDRRYATALDFAEDLYRVQRLRPIVARRPSLAGRAWRWAQREPLQAALGALLLTAMLGASGLAGYIASKREATGLGEENITRRTFERELARAMVETRQGDLPAARRHLAVGERIRPGDMLVLFSRMWLDLEGGNDEAAMRRISEGHMSPTTKNRLRAHLFLMRRETAAAQKLRSSLVPAQSADELVLEARLALLYRPVSVYDNPRRAAQASHAFKLLLRAILKSPDAQLHHYVFLADAAARSKNKDYCAYCAESLAELFPDEPLAVDALARCLGETDPKRGLEIALEARQRWPERTIVLSTISYLHSQLGEGEKAIESLRELIRLDTGRRHYTLRLLVSILVAKGDLDEAERMVREGLKRWPGTPTLMGTHADVLMRQRKLDEAQRQFQRALAASPRENPILRAAYADLLQMKGEFEAAEEQVRRSLAVDPHGDAWFTLGKILNKTRRYKEALEAFDEARQVMSNFLGAHLQHADVAMRLNKPDLARPSFQRALEIRNDAPRAHYMLGFIAQRKGEFELAMKHYRAVGPRDPCYPMALCNLAMMLAHSGKAAEALPLIKKGHELGSKRKNWRYQSASWVHEVERLKKHQDRQKNRKK